MADDRVRFRHHPQWPIVFGRFRRREHNVTITSRIYQIIICSDTLFVSMKFSLWKHYGGFSSDALRQSYLYLVKINAIMNRSSLTRASYVLDKFNLFRGPCAWLEFLSTALSLAVKGVFWCEVRGFLTLLGNFFLQRNYYNFRSQIDKVYLYVLTFENFFGTKKMLKLVALHTLKRNRF